MNKARLGIPVLIAALGCSSSSGGSQIASFCRSYLDVAADYQYRCEGGSRDALDEQLRAVGLCDSATRNLSVGHVVLDRASADACIQELKALECWQDVNAAPHCAQVFTGTVAEGGACYGDLFPLFFDADECVSGTRCLPNTTVLQCTGTCVRSPQLGEPCDPNAGRSPCAPGLSCDNLVCVEPPAAAIGAPCTASSACVSEGNRLTCVGANGVVNPDGTEAGTCQPPGDQGRCWSNSDCLSERCPGGTGVTAGTCVPRKLVGDACTPGGFECGGGTYCGTASVCVVFPSLGQSCAGNAGEGRSCLDGWCDSATATCQPFGKLGQPCEPGFIGSSCGLGTFLCDSMTVTCAYSCAPANPCGAAGQICCASQLCNAGLACTSGRCG